MTQIVLEAAEFIRRKTSLRPTLAIVLGSGFSSVLDLVFPVLKVSYAAIPGFAVPGVIGHAGELIIGQFKGLPIFFLNGRSHFYEGREMEEITRPIRVLQALGVKEVILTNSAGGIHKKYRAGDFMLFRDHINFMGQNPLRGLQDANRFVDLSQVYDPALSDQLVKIAGKSRIRLHRGVYLAVSGPSYETPAEIEAFSRMGADAVGMSTVPEAIVARHAGLKVAALSCITNPAAGRSTKPLSHAEVLATARASSGKLHKLMGRFFESYSKNLK